MKVIDTCAVIISATSQIVLLGSQLIAAFISLVNTCIDDPISNPSGGRAYYGVHSAPGVSIEELFGPSRRKRDAADVTGLNALPPPINMTVFAHSHSANVICEVQAVQNG